MPRITDFCSCIYVLGCKLSLVRLCDSDFEISPVDDITIGIICAAFCFHIAHISFASSWYLFCCRLLFWRDYVYLGQNYYYYYIYKIRGNRPSIMLWLREIIIAMEISLSLTGNPIQTAEFLLCPNSGTRRPNICFVHLPRGKHKLSENPSYIIHETAVTLRKKSKHEHHIGSSVTLKVTHRAPMSHPAVALGPVRNLRSDARRQCPEIKPPATSFG